MLEDSFDQCFREHFDAVWRYARRRTATSTNADDISAETFAVAWRRREDIPEADLRPWLFGVARKVLLNHSRTVWRRERLHHRMFRMRQRWRPWTRRSADETLWSAMSALSAEDRDVLIMRAWDELAVGEIAAILGCTTNAASVRLSRARTRLATELRLQEGQDLSPEVTPHSAPTRSNHERS